MKPLLRFLCVLLICCPLLAQSPELLRQRELLAGTYYGEVFNGVDMDPVVTTFHLAANGRLTGEYHVDEETGAYSGVLSNIILAEDGWLSMEWTDKFGEGFAQLEFSRDFSSFTGIWTDKFGVGGEPWHGRKQPSLPAEP